MATFTSNFHQSVKFLPTRSMIGRAKALENENAGVFFTRALYYECIAEEYSGTPRKFIIHEDITSDNKTLLYVQTHFGLVKKTYLGSFLLYLACFMIWKTIIS